MSKSHIGVALYDFVLNEKRWDINENIDEILISHQKRLIKRNICEDKYEKEVRPTFMITTAATVWEACMVWGIGKGPKRRIMVRERRGLDQLTGRRKIKTEIMREAEGGRRRMLSLI